MNSNTLFVLLAVLVGLGAERACARPFTYASSSADVKEYVVDCITNCICIASVALMHEKVDECEEIIPWYICNDLDLISRRCVTVLKGDASLSGYKVCYLYKTTLKCARERPYLCDSISSGDGRFSYFQDGKYYGGRGKDIWKLDPPYDPFSSYMDEFVQLMFLTPIKTVLRRRINLNVNRPDKAKSVRGLIGEDFEDLDSRALMQKLNIENVFSNRVFRMNEGCAFQVDYPVPDMEWGGLGTKEEHLKHLKSVQEGNSVLMHLSSDEASEIVYLSYLADKRYAAEDYDAACKRCPKLLKPVRTLKTEIGKRLKTALESGGMLPINDTEVKSARHQ